MILAPCPVCHRMKVTVNAKMDQRRLRTHHYRKPDTLLVEVVNQPICAGSQQLVSSDETVHL